MKTRRLLRQMAGVIDTPWDKAIKRHKREIDRRERKMVAELMLVDAIARRQRGEEGTSPMPFRKMRSDLEKMAKGEL